MSSRAAATGACASKLHFSFSLSLFLTRVLLPCHNKRWSTIGRYSRRIASSFDSRVDDAAYCGFVFLLFFYSRFVRYTIHNVFEIFFSLLCFRVFDTFHDAQIEDSIVQLCECEMKTVMAVIITRIQSNHHYQNSAFRFCVFSYVPRSIIPSL